MSSNKGETRDPYRYFGNHYPKCTPEVQLRVIEFHIHSILGQIRSNWNYEYKVRMWKILKRNHYPEERKLRRTLGMFPVPNNRYTLRFALLGSSDQVPNLITKGGGDE